MRYVRGFVFFNMNKISIPHLLSIQVSNDRVLRRHLCVFLKLKSLFKSSSIHDIKSCKKSLASSIGISEGKLRSSLAYLYKNNLCWIDNGGCLRFISGEKLSLKYNDFSCKYKLKMNLDSSIENINLFIVACAIDENLKRQQHAVENKIVNKTLKSYGKVHVESTEKAIKRGIRKKLSTATSKLNCNRVRDRRFNDAEQEINSAVTLSRRGVSKLMGLNSISSGSTMARRLVTADLLEDKKNIVRLESGVTFEMFKSLNLNKQYYYNNSNIFKRMTNTISLKST